MYSGNARDEHDNVAKKEELDLVETELLALEEYAKSELADMDFIEQRRLELAERTACLLCYPDTFLAP